MARPYRLQSEDCFYHITSRGDGRKSIYKSERDYEKFLEYLSAAKSKFKFYIHAYCLMTNHYHLFIETTQANLSRIMQYLNTSYTVYYNRKRAQAGHLFQGRYKSIIVEQDAYYSELTRYIHLNPVRAKMVKKPADYPWSSYNVYLKGKGTACIDIDHVKQRLSMPLSRYREFVESGYDQPDPFKAVYAGSMLGSVKFIKEKLNRLQAEVETKDFAYKRALSNAIEPETIIAATAEHFKIDTQVLTESVRRPMTAKKTAIYLLRKNTGLTCAQIGAIFHMKPMAISMAAIKLAKEIKINKQLRAVVERIDCSFRV
jgi:putative transposase